ncbi:hypothetical protein JB92DRAFT_3124942 [Gautieria morchelliformis]|nr:hypothetical protein JB92DRAFT_3124942 [Gautieria morchelliformis]
MAPTVQPPPSLPDEPPGHLAAAPLATILGKLSDLIYGISLPKTKAAKSATISLDALHKSRNLISSAQSALKDPRPDLQLDSINKQLEVISTHIGLPNAIQSISKRTSASVLTSSTSSAPPPPPDAKTPFRNTQFDLTLAQSNRNSPVFADLSDEDLGEEVGKAVEDAECWFDTRIYTLDADGNEDAENLPRGSVQ